MFVSIYNEKINFTRNRKKINLEKFDLLKKRWSRILRELGGRIRELNFSKNTVVKCLFTYPIRLDRLKMLSDILFK